jgi:RNA polymerase sigma factor (sigma-70 family)
MKADSRIHFPDVFPNLFANFHTILIDRAIKECTMDKQTADSLMEQYMKPLYGFALNRTKQMQEAEELAGRIVLQVYEALLKKDDIADLNGYVYKIAHNVWARYLGEKSKSFNNVSVSEMEVSADFDLGLAVAQNEQAGILRREIAFLSKQRRAIVTAYYYNRRNIAEIANELRLSEGTVKWHLFECKKELKKGMNQMREIGNLGLHPVRFTSMGHGGSPGAKGDTADFLAKTLTQNIAYACYHQQRTVNEIARELGVSPVFVEDEVNELTEYGFMEKLPNGKYQTQILIREYSQEQNDAIRTTFENYAERMVDAYFIKLYDLQQELEALPILYTDQDFNFLMWSLIPYATQRLWFQELELVKFDDIAVKRKDGGYYYAHAHINRDIWDNTDVYNYCGYMSRVHQTESIRIEGFKLAVHWSGAEIGWRDNLTSDYEYLYHFIHGNLPQNEVNLSVYERLVEKGYLVPTDGGYKANIVYIPNEETKRALNRALPAADRSILEIGRQLDEALFRIQKAGQPQHMHQAVRFETQNSLTKIHVFVMKQLLDRGLLNLPAPEVRKAICTILFNHA